MANKTRYLFNKVKISRLSVDGDAHDLMIQFKNEKMSDGVITLYRENTGDKRTEDDFVSFLLDKCEEKDDLKDTLRYVNHENLRSKVKQCFQQLRENQLSGDSRDSMEFILELKEPHEVDSSGEKIQNEDSIQESGDKL